MNNNELLNIDHLRSFDVEPAYFGLGFIQLKITQNSRVHFYHKELPVLIEEPHDHRYRFISYILQGKFEQTLHQFDLDNDGEYEMYIENCKPNLGTVPIGTRQPQPGNLKEIMHCRFQAGDRYEIDADALHTVQGKQNAITCLIREEPTKEFARVIRETGVTAVCPYSQPIAVDKCWEMIEDMLPKTDTFQDLEAIESQSLIGKHNGVLDSDLLPKKKKSKFGYHIADIPKGKIGEPSKIVEEAMEIADAHEQGVKIMAAVEMSDLYGALDRYREKYHSDMSMKDVEDMYRVTRRAFDNGKRK